MGIILYIFLILITLNIWSEFVPNSNYADELTTIFALALCILGKKNHDKDTYGKWIVVSITGILLLGIISTIKYHIQPEFAGVWRDALAISKFPICYCAFNTFVSNKAKRTISP